MLKLRSRPLLASARTCAALTLCVVLLGLTGPSAVAQNGTPPRQDGQTVGVPSIGALGVERTTADLMAAQAIAPPSSSAEWRMMRKELELPDRENLPQDPNAAPVASAPVQDANAVVPAPRTEAAQTVSMEFTGATLADTGAFPPDSMGAVGPAQFFVFVNGRLRTFSKTTGTADGVINLDPDVFFSSVMTPPPGAMGLNFTSDPQVRYDRLTQRWILTIIDVPSTSPASVGDTPNRVLIAVSDAASAGVISSGTVWTFYFVQQDTVGGPSTGEFLDYDSLGVDANALYVGGNMFNATTSAFTGTSAFVIRKSSILSGGPVVTTAFRGLITGGDGPDSPRGVDNYDPAATEGYFIGASDAAFGRLIMRRISTPGATPAISANIAITVATTAFPIKVDHLGDTGGTNGNLDALDDRLFAAHIRNGRLWTAHNIAVSDTGIASVSAERRDGVRWYELVVPPGSGTPTVNQSGTVFDNAVTVATARQFWIPSVTVSGQGHAALGFSTAGTPFHAEAATTGRLAGSALGTLDVTQIYSDSPGVYNPPSDPGGASGRRWGDYSFVSLDPDDDMTMWTIQEFCNATNSYGVSVAKLLAPPPATPSSSSPASIAAGSASTSVTITGTTAGSGFFDPGPGFARRLTASVSGGVTVNSAAYVNPTTVTLNLSTVSATLGPHNVTITNPDGQVLTGIGILDVAPAGTPPSITTQPLSQAIPSGSTATMSVTAIGSPTLMYQWYVGPSGNTSSPIGGATSSSYTTPPLTTTTSYWVRVSNAFGMADSNTATISIALAQLKPGDFDGDSKDDPAIYRPSTGLWAILKSSTGYTTSTTVSWGASTDVPRAGDYDGDGKTDPAIYRPSTGGWYILKSSTNYTTSFSVLWGLSTDVPLLGDFDGDGKADPAIYRPSTGLWAILKSSTAYTTSMTVSWGLGTDLPVPGDYDGDGKADPAIYRPSTGLWAILKSSTGFTTSATVSWGLSTDVAVPGDYDGDGKTDPAVYRPSTGGWFMLKSSTNYTTSVGVAWGLSTDVPVAADFDGDGKTDPAIFRPSTGLWAILKSSTSYGSGTYVSWGLSTDIPIYRRP